MRRCKRNCSGYKKDYRRFIKKPDTKIAHGILALEIAEHTLEETLEHTGLGGDIEHRPDAKAHLQAKQWLDAIKEIQNQGSKFLRAHPNEDLETALKALAIAEGSLEEVTERYE